jgi:hypothetical protein
VRFADIDSRTQVLKQLAKHIASPGAVRLKKFLMAMGMLYFMAGSVVRGCSTLAPK